MIDIELPDEIRGHVENELDFLIKHIDQFQEEWLAQADINPDDDEAVVAFALGALMLETEHFLEEKKELGGDDEDPDQYLQEAAKIIKKRRSEILSAIREEQMT
jgi:hypothetical protein